MATYSSLDQEQKDILAAWEKQGRAVSRSMAKLLNELRALMDAADASNGPRDIVALLDNTEQVPNSSGLAGAHNLTKAEWAAIIAIFDAYITAHDVDSVRQNFTKAGGVTAGL